MKPTVRPGLLLVLLPALLMLPARGDGQARPPVPADTTDFEPARKAATRLLEKEMRKNDVVGLSIALVDDRRVIWSRGFGFADKKAGIPASPETIYRIGSITKLFTASVAMQLAEKGALRIDQPLRTYLPEFSIRSRFADVAGSVITLRQLMTHHAGLPNNVQKGMWSRSPEPPAALIERLRDEYTVHPPGLAFSYSNTGAALLGLAAERTAGRPYSSLVRDGLLQPLAMERSGFLPVLSGNDVAKGYREETETVEPLLRDTPAGGMYSTVLDLGRFLQMVLNGGSLNGTQVLQAASVAEMLRPQNTDAPLDRGLVVGLGWMLSGLGEIDIQHAGTVAHHAGATLLFHGQMIALPDHKLGVVVLANSSSASRVVNRLAAQAISLALEAKAGITQPAAVRSGEADTVLSRDAQREYEGQYASMAGLVSISPRSDHLHAKVMQRTLQLVPLDDGRFGIKYRLFGFIPISLGELDQVAVSRSVIAGREVLLARLKGRELVVAEKVPRVPVPDAWLRRLGAYRIGSLGDDFSLLREVRLRYEDGLLLAEISVPFFFKGAMCFPLLPLSDTEAVTAGLGRGLGETVRVVSVDGGEALRYSGYLFLPDGRR